MTTAQQKQVGLVILMLIYSGLIFWYAAINVNITTFYPLVIIASAIALAIWVALLAITLGLLESALAPLPLVLGLPILLIISGRGAPGAIAAAIILGLILASAHSRIQAEIKGRIKFHVFAAFFKGTRLIIFGLMIIFAGLTMGRLVEQFSGRGVQIPESYVTAIADPIIKNLTGPDSRLLPQSIVDQVTDQQIEQLYPNLSPSEKDIVRQQIASQTQADQPLIAINEQLPQIVTATINQQLGLMTKDNPVISAIALLFGLILLTRVFIPIIALPILGLIGLILAIAQQLGFIFIYKTQETVERLKI